MILKKYIQFVNEKISKVDVNDYDSTEFWDLNKAGISVHTDGTLYVNQKTDELHITTSLHEHGEFIYDLTDKGHTNLTIKASHAGLRTFEGLPSLCNSFIGTGNKVRNLIGGPEEANGYYGVNDCTELTSFEGAPMYCSNFEAQRTSVRNCFGLFNILSDKVDVSLLNNDKLESLEGLPINTKYLNVTNCKNLTSLEHVPIDIEHIIIIGCSSLKTLYHIRDIEGGVFDTVKAFEGTGVPKIEVSYFLYNKNDGDNYHEALFNHAKAYGMEDIGKVIFPASFIEELNDKDKELLRSSKGINKFDL